MTLIELYTNHFVLAIYFETGFAYKSIKTKPFYRK